MPRHCKACANRRTVAAAVKRGEAARAKLKALWDQGLSHSDIAKAMGISHRTVATLLAKYRNAGYRDQFPARVNGQG